MPRSHHHARRPALTRLGIATLATVLAAACEAPSLTGFTVEEADEPSGLWVSPDSIAVGAVAGAYAMGCIPTSEVCVFPVRGIRWAVADTRVAELDFRVYDTSAEVLVRGRRPGQTNVVATTQSGRQYAIPIWIVP